MVREFGIVEVGSLRFALVGSLTTIEASLHVSSHAVVPPVISFNIGGEVFLVRVNVLPEKQRRRWTGLGHHVPGREEEKDEDMGGMWQPHQVRFKFESRGLLARPGASEIIGSGHGLFRVASCGPI